MEDDDDGSVFVIVGDLREVIQIMQKFQGTPLSFQDMHLVFFRRTVTE